MMQQLVLWWSVLNLVAQAALAKPVVHGFDRPPFPKQLSAWGIFEKTSTQFDLAADVTPYELNNPLFSDYADKFRTIWVPRGQKIRYRAEGPFDFPVGTVLTKTFSYPRATTELAGQSLLSDTEPVLQDERLAPLRGEYLLETRLLVRTQAGWVTLPYVWNAEQTEASLAVGSKRFALRRLLGPSGNDEFQYMVPNANQCQNCHMSIDGFKRIIRPLGPTAANLNRNFNYPAFTKNQLQAWEDEGLLEGLPSLAEVPKVAVWNDPLSGSLAERARAYLDINCSHCHSATGAAKPTHLHLGRQVTKPIQYGVCKSPVAPGNGAANTPYDIFPGKPDHSLIVYRLSSRQPEVMMPELGRDLVHEEGVQLIRAWIADMAGDCHNP